MEITDVRIRKLHMAGSGEGAGRMRAIVSVTFDNEFVVHDIKVIEGEQKHFIAMPSRKIEDGTYKDITHPIKSGLRNKLQDVILARYEQALNEERLRLAAETLNAPEPAAPAAEAMPVSEG